MNTADQLKRGDRGEAVRELQEALARHHFDTGKIDGVFGEKTETAVKDFQRTHSLTVDGIVGKATQKQLAMATAITQSAALNLSWNKDAPTIVLDPGHGAYRDENEKVIVDPGATTQKDGALIRESDINLTLGKAIKKHLEPHGFRVVLTREEGTTLKNRFDVRLEKNEDNKHVHISLHADSADPSVNGIRTFYSAHSDLGKKLAEAIAPKGQARPHLTALLDANRLKCYATLIEMGNIQNPEDLERLTSKTGQEQTAKEIASKIVTFYNKERRVNASLPPLPGRTTRTARSGHPETSIRL